TFGWDGHLRGHWSDRTAAIDQDLTRMTKLLEEAKSGSAEPSLFSSAKLKQIWQELCTIVPANRTSFTVVHEPLKKFRPGEEITISATVNNPKNLISGQLQTAQLYYRHVNQAENYQTVEMKVDGDRWVTVIPADYTQSPFPLQYYFKLRSE